MIILGLILVFSGIIAFEAPRLLKAKMWGELMAFGGLLTVSMVMTFAAVFNIELPNPTTYIEIIFGPISEAIISFLE